MDEMEENLRRQQEEIEALSSIYEDSFILDSVTSFTILVTEDCGEVVLRVNFPPNYPASSPPIYQKSAPFLSRTEKQTLCNLLDEVYIDNLGECVVYLWVEQIRTFLQKRSDSLCDNEDDENIDHSLEENILATALLNSGLDNTPPIQTGNTIEDRRSVFQGHTAKVRSTDEVKLVLDKLYENKKIAHATHNIYAYRIYCEDKQSWLCDCEDDGEDAAGGRLLHLLEILDAVDTLVVVSRWYGGTHLGPDRFKHINNAARQVLETAGVIGLKEEKGKKKKGK